MKETFFKSILALGAALLAGAAGAENLIPNGDLTYLIQGKPAFWSLGKEGAAYDPTACEGAPALVITDEGMARQFSSLRIVPKAKYRLTAKVRLSKSNPKGRADIMVINQGWGSSMGIMNIEPAAEWRTVSADIYGFPSSDQTYGIVVRGRALGGKLEVGALTLEALTVEGKAGSRSLFFAPGSCESLNTNGALDADQSEFPSYWATDGGAEFLRGGGPGGKNALRFDVAKVKSAAVRQDRAMMLKAGKRYRVSMMVKAENFKAKRMSYTIFADSWGKEGGVVKVPSDCGWTRVEAIVFAPPCKTNYGSGLAMRTDAHSSGRIDIADLRVEPLDEAAADGAYSLLRGLEKDRLVVLSKLAEIPADKPVIAARWFGKKPAADAMEYRLDGGAWQKTAPAADGSVEIPLKGIASGDHTLEFRCGEFSRKWPFTVVEALPPVKSRRLNNLVRELEPLTLADGETGEFINPRTGWVYFILPSPDATLEFSTEKPVRGAGHAYLRRGKNRITLKGAAGKVTVRTVPEIYTYQLAGGPYLDASPKNDYKLISKYLLPYINSYAQPLKGNLTEAEWKIIYSTNLQRQHGNHIASYPTAQAMIEGVNGNEGLNDPKFVGITFDEFPAGDVTLMARYNDAHDSLKRPEGHRFYYCLYGKLAGGGIAAEFLSNAVNSGHGDSIIKYESYCQPVETEEAAEAYIRNIIVETAKSLDRAFPGVVKNLCMYMINCNTPATLTAAYLTDVDLKYYLDMQFHLIATAPELEGLAMAGNWGSNYADNEMVRWTGRLFRHYLVEGNTERLAPRYGFTYSVDFVRNADFEKGLEGWDVSGTVKAGHTPGYGRTLQKRWSAPNGIGDSYAVLERGAEPNVLSQKLKGIKRGRYYKLQYITADAEDVLMQGGGKPGDLSVECEIDGAEFVPEETVRYRARGPFRKIDKNMFKVNLDCRVFKAAQDDPVIRFTDRAVAPGRKTALNYIYLTPFFEKE